MKKLLSRDDCFTKQCMQSDQVPPPLIIMLLLLLLLSLLEAEVQGCARLVCNLCHGIPSFPSSCCRKVSKRKKQEISIKNHVHQNHDDDDERKNNKKRKKRLK